VEIFSSSSVEAANIANNHIMDYGKQGYNDTIKTLEDAGIKHFGYYDDAIFDIKGIKIGIFGFAFDSDESNIKEAIDKLKGQGAEYVVAVFHQGTEKVYEPNEQQITAAHAAIDNGASLVIGHHPHVVQGVTEYKGATIAYSLGNFCFGGNTNPDDKDSMIFQVTVTRNADGFKTEHEIIPASISSSTNHNDYRPRVLKGSEGKRVLKKIQDFSKAL
jgi:poly-gamma-glutamate synthesis protein (capsule biosynthesis protein)